MPDDAQFQRGDGKARGRWLKPALFVSLALNLAVAGVVAGAVWRHGGPGSHRGEETGAGRPGWAFVMALPREDRRALRAEARRGRDAGTARHGARRTADLVVLDALRADPFDPEAVRAALSVQSEAGLSALRRTQAAWLERVLAMDAAGRAAYADAVERLLRRAGREPRP